MKTAKIAQIADLADGQLIGEMTFKIKKTFPHRTGAGQYGAWSVQNAIVVDDTGEIRASFWADGDEPLKGLEGHDIQVKSVAGKRGLTGISAKANKKDGSMELDIKASAAIRSLNADNGATVARTQTPAATVLNPTAARRRIFQSAQLYIECVKAARYISENTEISSENFQAAVASLYISADKAGLASSFPDSPAKQEDEIPMDHAPKARDEFEEEAGW